MSVIGSRNDHAHVDTVVVGAGLGGLSTAAFLATNGQKVLVLEQHHVVGGSAQVFRRHDDAYQFDVGVHHVGECEPGGRMRTLLDALGVDDRIEWRQLDPDGFSFISTPEVSMRVPVGWDSYEARLVETFPDEAENVRRCVQLLREVAAELRTPAPGGALGGLRTKLATRTTRRWAGRPLAALLDHCDLSPVARTVVAGECGGYAAPPSRATVGVHASHLDHHLTSGAWYPRGGGQVLPARLLQVVEAHGGEVRTGVQVDRVMVEGGRAVGVTLLDGTEIHADNVVSSSDPQRTYLGLVGREHLPKKLLRTAESWVPALPLLTVHLVLDVDLRGVLPDAAQWIHPRSDLEAFYDATYAGRTDVPGPVLMTSATVKDPDGTRSAPAGRSTLQLVTVAPSDHATWHQMSGGPSAGERYSHNPGYLATKERLTQAVVDTAARVVPDLRDHVVHLETSTPLTQERFTLATHGTAFGLEVNRDQVGRSRPDARSPIPGLFLAGAGTRYMRGVLATVHGGAGTAGAVLGRDLLAEMADGKRYGSPDAVPADGPDWDPLVVSAAGSAAGSVAGSASRGEAGARH